jgi:hypothetical protein
MVMVWNENSSHLECAFAKGTAAALYGSQANSDGLACIEILHDSKLNVPTI